MKLDKYAKIELTFFIVYFYVFKLLSNLEYNFWERKLKGFSGIDIEFSFLYGTSGLLAFIVFYQIIKFYLVNRKFFRLIACLVLFLVAYALYQKAVNYTYSQLPFLSDEFRRLATNAYRAKSIGYSFAYMFKEFLAVGCLAFVIHSMKQDEKVRQLKEQQLMSELTYLKSQLQPHFFFNTLNNIYSLALKQSEDTAPLVAKLADMMRYILYKTDRPLVLLKDEIAFVKNYVEVEQIRYRSNINISLDIQGIDEHTTIAPLLLLPFIENAFKHGVEEEVTTGYITIKICKIANELILEVENSIAQKEHTGEGVGLVNVKKRLALLYPDKYTLTVQSDELAFYVNLSIQL
ncbi:sensor histidine kinase [Pedobacter montanisoli]|uniref:Histidine kinase n=1 Tax=Pedobacter montanisoli TaxID=2923277 RepID=A0ABS9ZWH8_9SPHI|nr:histidine kinase [Pedobacter montanisoli]MCJ0742670.1 histidine kinase [Pedobacter montanisoli]